MNHSIPLEVLNDLSVLETMVLEISKVKYFEKNPSRVRVPAGYGQGVTLKLTGISPGSAIPELSMEFDQSTAEPVEILYYEEARDTIIRVVNAASKNEDVLEYLDKSHLSYFDRLGRSLEANESIDLAPNDSLYEAVLTKDIRMKLIEASRIEETSKKMTLRGGVEEFDQANMTCKVTLASGQRLSANVPEAQFDVVMKAFTLLKKDNVRASFEGLVCLDKQDYPKHFEEIQNIALIEPNDVAYRLDELSLLEEKWLDGKGLAFKNSELSELASLFENYSPSKLPAPYIYPTIEGTLLAEWSLSDGVEANLEISPDNKNGELIVFFVADGEEEEVELSLDLGLASAWDELASTIIRD